ncbi:MAG: hypothetical protein CMJ59_10620 [Planctomycetaceae bacterium]|nr:hypothetical protein [Planctomycetaceae bacterium]
MLFETNADERAVRRAKKTDILATTAADLSGGQFPTVMIGYFQPKEPRPQQERHATSDANHRFDPANGRQRISIIRRADPRISGVSIARYPRGFKAC